MIFTGDVAVAHGDKFIFRGFHHSLVEKPWCLNLEGAIDPLENIHPSWGVTNTPNWFASFVDFNIGPVFIGNNHVHDIANGVRQTLIALADQGLISFGAGLSDDVAGQAA